MSEAYPPSQSQSGMYPPPGYYPPPPPPRSPLGCLFSLSLLLNIIAGIAIVLGCFGYFSSLGKVGSIAGETLTEKHYGGERTTTDKVAIVTLEGVIMEGFISFTEKQIRQAARDKDVKAVVFRINSPGGSITASDLLWRRITELRDGNPTRGYAAKPVVVSMGSLAASGGYYVAMPGQYIFAERTTLTGSVGVYASFPNVNELAEKWGFDMITIKQGEIKDSGSPFKKMSPKERIVWKSMVNQAYDQFVEVVKEGRTRDGKLLLTHPPLERFAYKPVEVENDPENPAAADKEKLTRYIADGGIWTAKEALDLKLIDEIGYLDAAVVKARGLASLAENTHIVEYEKPKTLGEALFGIEQKRTGLLPAGKLHRAFAPRLWYLAPGSELAGFLAAIEE